MADRPSSIPLVDLAAEHREVADEVRAGWDRVLERGAFVLGPELTAFEGELAAFTGAAGAVGVGSGTDAVELALRAAGLQAGDEVVVPANSFVASAMAVVRAGGRPRFVDVDPDTLLVDAGQVDAALAAGARGVLPVHLYGRLAPMPELLAVAKAHGAWVVEDAAQAHGARLDGVHAGAFGVPAALSFYPSKNLGAYGDGGAVLAPDAAVAARLRSLRNHGLGDDPDAGHRSEGWNSRLDELQAVVLRAKLHRLAEWVDRRRAAAHRYDVLLAEQLPDLRRPGLDAGAAHAWHLYVVRVPHRDAVLAHLRQRGIGAGVHYRRALPQEGAFTSLGHRPGEFPVAEQAAAEVLSLPLGPFLTEADQERVVASLVVAVDRSGRSG